MSSPFFTGVEVTGSWSNGINRPVSWKTHSISQIAKLQKKYGEMKLAFGKYKKGANQYDKKNGCEEEFFSSKEITISWFERKLADLKEDEFYGIQDLVEIGKEKWFWPMADFTDERRPKIPYKMNPWFGFGPYYRTTASWHLYGDGLFRRSLRAEFFKDLEASFHPDTFSVDDGWIHFSTEVRNFAVLRWSSKEGKFPEEK